MAFRLPGKHDKDLASSLTKIMLTVSPLYRSNRVRNVDIGAAVHGLLLWLALTHHCWLSCGQDCLLLVDLPPLWRDLPPQPCGREGAQSGEGSSQKKLESSWIRGAGRGDRGVLNFYVKYWRPLFLWHLDSKMWRGRGGWMNWEIFLNFTTFFDAFPKSGHRKPRTTAFCDIFFKVCEARLLPKPFTIRSSLEQLRALRLLLSPQNATHREVFKKWKFKMPFAMKGGRGLACHKRILKNDCFKNHLESFPDCQSVFCT